ncbi:hypothetical protein OZX62_04820 [Bifidobacterium sp. ESL0690]|uniref:hypothetical protein n=1 Tax=Bifidobacterium sp. ESL0690 TaxID=2983214 RepID=UPI0023F88745|nr:hypothetical protein [Bifidobacterium sp. ESL0690]WEV47592.1 hypothetical protein OZX62_04820 [Bifidobacterium sp. ESL0690]
MIGVSICNLEESTVRSQFKKAKLLKGKKVHWYDMDSREHEKSISLINGLKLHHVSISAEPLLKTMRPERARRKCLETLLPILEIQYGVTHLFMESRNVKQDHNELRFIQTLHAKQFVRALRYELLPGGSDSRLWLPDQILGASEGCESERLVVNDLERFSISL